MQQQQKHLTGDMAFYKFLAERSIFTENFEGICFWTSLEEIQILLLFVFPGMIFPPETDVIYRQLIYNQLTATTQHIPWLNLWISMGVFYPDFCLSCDICSAPAKKTPMRSWVQADSHSPKTEFTDNYLK